MTRTQAVAFFVGIVGTALFLKAQFWTGPDWQTSYQSGVQAYREGNYVEAEKQFSSALSAAEELNADDGVLMSTLNSLWDVYQRQGKYAQAEPLLRRVLELNEKSLGADHPNVAASLNNLAGNYRAQGNLAEAEPLYKRSLEIWEKIMGREHPLVVDARNNYVELLRQMGRDEEAEVFKSHVSGVPQPRVLSAP